MVALKYLQLFYVNRFIKKILITRLQNDLVFKTKKISLKAKNSLQPHLMIKNVLFLTYY